MEEMFVSEVDEVPNNDGGSERTESRNTEGEKAEQPETEEEVEEIDQKPLPIAAGLEQVSC